AMTEPWGRPEELATVAANALKATASIANCLKRANDQNDASPKQLSFDALFGPDLGAVAADPLLHCLLTLTPVTDRQSERFLTTMRRALLDSAVGATASDKVADDGLTLACALARQCFINGYVFRCGDDEIAQVHRLRDGITAALS